MHRQFARCLVACTAVVLAFPVRSANAQAAIASATMLRPAELAGLYRMVTPSTDSTSVIHFLRLFPDGRSRMESVRIDASRAPVRARVEVQTFHRRPWGLKTSSASAAPQLCFEMRTAEACTAFHREMPRGDLHLFAPGAHWGSPTLILRRQANFRSH